jgi:glycosyltransferase involved in cell wall biosynthesis
MGFGSAILFQDHPATREVIGEDGEAFSPQNPASALAEKLRFLSENPEHCKELGLRAKKRAVALFDWEKIMDQYENLFEELLKK